MSSLDEALATLMQERTAAQQRLQDVDLAIEALRRLLPAAEARASVSAQGALVASRDRESSEYSEDDSAGGTPGIRELILGLFTSPGEELKVDDIYRGLVAAGWTTTSERPRHMVASNLSKLAGTGQLIKAGYGAYRSPALFEVDEPSSSASDDEVDDERFLRGLSESSRRELLRHG